MITPTCCHHSAPLIEGAAAGNRSPEPISQLKEVTMARPYLPSFFGRGDDPFGSLFREVQKTFEDFSQRTPFARFGADELSPKIDIAESKDAIDVKAELPGAQDRGRRPRQRTLHLRSEGAGSGRA